MTHGKSRTVMLSTVGALVLMPALAMAQGSSNSPSGQGTSTAQEPQGSGSKSESGTSGSASQKGEMSGSQRSGKQSSMQKGSSTSPSARQSIDPAEVQRVFGSDAMLMDLQSLGPDQIRSLQQSLQDRGHYTGTVDGVYGAQTRAGLRALLAQQYSLNRRLIEQGQITGLLASSMGLEQSDRATVGGTDSSAGPSSPSMNGSQQRPGGSQSPSSPNTGSTGSSGTSGTTNGAGAPR